MSDFNGVLFHYFHWYLKSSGQYWNEVAAQAKELASAGFTALWLPPAYKGIGGINEVGYGVYDLYDLGEFDQKGTVRTKYGTKDEYLACIKSLHSHGISVYADIVLNHMMGGDETEKVKALPISKENRFESKGDWREVECYTHFKFPGRNGKYSRFEWRWNHFDAVDYVADSPNDQSTIYLFEGKGFNPEVSKEKGNFDYLMGCDIDHASTDVHEQLVKWGKWYLDTTGVDSFRLDAVKHISTKFFPPWLKALEEYSGKELLTIGEYWENSCELLLQYLDATENRIHLFDVPLHYNFYFASKTGGDFDMRKIFDGSLVSVRPDRAITFVSNHDTQQLQELESVVEAWFTPLAYALILLRRSGYPSVFYPDYYGAEYDGKDRQGNDQHIVLVSHRMLIDVFLEVRRTAAFGEQYDYFDHPDVVGWTRLGDEKHPLASAIILTNKEGGIKRMEVKRSNATFKDLTGHCKELIKTGEDGWGEFRCNGGSVSVWVEQK